MADFKINGTTFVSETGGTLSIDASQIKVNGTTVIGAASGFMFRNKIINGGMKISQRVPPFTFAYNGTVNGYTLDRFYFDLYNNPDQYDCTVSQYSMSAAEISTTGHTKALKLLTGTAESAIDNDEFVRFYYIAEGQDVQDFQHGTASAKTMTLSFWTKSSVTGTFGLGIYRPVSSGNARMINLSYTIDLPNTWEKKTILIVGDTGGATIPNDNTAGLYINWQLAAGSNWYSGTATSWGDYAMTRLMGNHSNAVITTAGADWYLTGVQLEEGTVATPFEHRPIGMELSLCQRYYQVFTYCNFAGRGASSTTCTFGVPLANAMRSMPTLTYTDAGGNAEVIAFGVSGHSIKSNATLTLDPNSGPSGAGFRVITNGVFSGLTDNRPVNVEVRSRLILAAEL